MIVVPLLLALAAAAPQTADAGVVGRYDVVGPEGETVCRLRLAAAGRIDAPPACGAVLPPPAGLRWVPVAGGGDYRIDDPGGRTIATIEEDEAGFQLVVRGRRYRLEALDQAPALTPAQRTAGAWQVFDPQAEVTRPLCRGSFRAGGTIGPATACPPPMRAFGGGRWRASEAAGALTAPGGRTLRLTWSDPATLEGPRGSVMLGADR